MLQRFAHFLIRNKRADDVLVRLGGDEFALFVEVVAPENLDIITERLMANAPEQAPIAFSIGRAYRVPGETLEEIIARADAAMYTPPRVASSMATVDLRTATTTDPGAHYSIFDASGSARIVSVVE